MEKLNRFVEFIGGSPQSRIFTTTDKLAKFYSVYGQMNLRADLVGDSKLIIDNNQIRTFDQVMMLKSGDVVFNFISGESTIVHKVHHGFLQTQNFVKVIPSQEIDSQYLVYLLNEDHGIKRQLIGSLQGTTVIKYTLAQLRGLRITKLPTIQQQRLIGQLYFNQLRLNWLRKQVADLTLKNNLTLIKERATKWTN